MRQVAGISAEEVVVSTENAAVRLLRVRGMEAFVDPAALLRSEEGPEPPYWMHLWPGANALARVVAAAPEVRPEARVLELGCGLALPALTAAGRGATVVASDWNREAVRFARASAALNTGTMAVMQMDWRAPALHRRFDVCLGAEIAYDQAAEASLVNALVRLLRPGGVAWLADSVSTERVSLAAALRAAGFAVRSGAVREREDGRPVWVRLIEARWGQ